MYAKASHIFEALPRHHGRREYLLLWYWQAWRRGFVIASSDGGYRTRYFIREIPFSTDPFSMLLGLNDSYLYRMEIWQIPALHDRLQDFVRRQLSCRESAYRLHSDTDYLLPRRNALDVSHAS
jgi:hypothetical protein